MRRLHGVVLPDIKSFHPCLPSVKQTDLLVLNAPVWRPTHSTKVHIKGKEKKTADNILHHIILFRRLKRWSLKLSSNRRIEKCQ